MGGGGEGDIGQSHDFHFRNENPPGPEVSSVAQEIPTPRCAVVGAFWSRVSVPKASTTNRRLLVFRNSPDSSVGRKQPPPHFLIITLISARCLIAFITLVYIQHLAAFTAASALVLDLFQKLKTRAVSWSSIKRA